MLLSPHQQLTRYPAEKKFALSHGNQKGLGLSPTGKGHQGGIEGEDT